MLADWNEDVKPANRRILRDGRRTSRRFGARDSRQSPEHRSRIRGQEGSKHRRPRRRRVHRADSGSTPKLHSDELARSWGPIGLSGLQLGNDAYTYDHLFARIGTEKIHSRTVIARLENYVLSPGVESSRYFSTHRLAFKRGRVEGGLSESFLYSGVGRGLEFSLINPLNVYSLSWRNERTDGNLSFGGDLAWRSKLRQLQRAGPDG